MTWPGSCVQPLVIWVAPSSQCMASRDTRASPLACLSRVTSRDSHKWRACPRKILEILVGTSNGTDHFGLVLPEYSGPDLKVVHFDRSGHFGRSDGNVPFHLKKMVNPNPDPNITIFRLAISAFFRFTDVSIGNSMISSDIWHKYHE